MNPDDVRLIQAHGPFRSEAEMQPPLLAKTWDIPVWLNRSVAGYDRVRLAAAIQRVLNSLVEEDANG